MTVLQKKSSREKAHYDIATIMGKSRIKGVVGIEVEVEGNKFPKHEYEGNLAVDPHCIPKMWRYHRDGSLRGKDNAEYVLDKPVQFEEVKDVINKLFDMFSTYGTVLTESNRTSVHIHLNAQSFYLNRLSSFCALYFCVEEILTQWCGDHRVGNLFCLRGQDAPGILQYLKKFVMSDGRSNLPDGLHYAALNLHALVKFGSIEVRTMRGVAEADTILTWVSILQRLYELSEEFKDPRDIPAMFSAEGPASFLEYILGGNTSTVLSGIDYSEEQVRDSLYGGIRLAQDLCYCRDWDLYKPVAVEEDVFRRVKVKPTSDDTHSFPDPSDMITTAPTLSAYTMYSQMASLQSPAWSSAPPPPPSAFTNPYYATATAALSELESEDEPEPEPEYEPEYDEDVEDF